jgi:hypothetical protein
MRGQDEIYGFILYFEIHIMWYEIIASPQPAKILFKAIRRPQCVGD